jgi:hypothetical protein
MNLGFDFQILYQLLRIFILKVNETIDFSSKNETPNLFYLY